MAVISSGRQLGLVAMAALLAACTAEAPSPGLAPGPFSSEAASPTPKPSSPETAMASPSGRAPWPSATAPASGGRKVVVSGTVYSEAGSKLDGCFVTVTSLDANQPYNASATTTQGAYVFNDVPFGVKVEVRVTLEGHTSRSQVDSFQVSNRIKNILDFGGTTANAPGRAYFLSNRPEIVGTTPAEDATEVDPAQLSLKLTLSEALDTTNRRRLEEALRITPANAEAAGSTRAQGHFLDMEGTDFQAENPATPGKALGADSFRYAIAQGGTFLSDGATRAQISWSPDGKEASLSFPAPLQASRGGAAKYNVMLLSSATEPIQDRDQLTLGTPYQAQSLSATYPPAELIYNAFKAKDLVASGSTPLALWDSTHDNASTFELRQDQEAPTLQSVGIQNVGSDTQIELSFNEAMVAFDGSATGSSWLKSGAQDPLGAFTFAVGGRGKLKDFVLPGLSQIRAKVSPTRTPTVGLGVEAIRLTQSRLGDGGRGVEMAFRLDEQAFTTLPRSLAARGQITMEVNPRKPQALLIYVVGMPKSELFTTDLAEFMVRVEGVTDPAGNAIHGLNADRHVVRGVL